MGEILTRSLRASRGPVDFNEHVVATASPDLAADARLLVFEDCGFSPRDSENLPSSLREPGAAS